MAAVRSIHVHRDSTASHDIRMLNTARVAIIGGARTSRLT